MSVIAFYPRSKCLLISWLHSQSAVILEPKKIKSLTISIFSHLYAMKWWNWMPWSSFFEYWVLSQLFHSPLWSSSRGLFSSSLLSALRAVSSAYLRLPIFILAILIPACDSSSPASWGSFYLPGHISQRYSHNSPKEQEMDVPSSVEHQHCYRYTTASTTQPFMQQRPIAWRG